MLEEIVVEGYIFRYEVEKILKRDYDRYCKRFGSKKSYMQYIVEKVKQNILLQKRKYPEEQEWWSLLSYIKEVEKSGYSEDLEQKVYIIQDQSFSLAWDNLPLPPNIQY